MVANGLEGVPWMVGGGAKHSANVGRLVAFLASGGSSGVVGPGDLKVTATPGTPDLKVHMATGAASIVNRSSNARSEAYAVRAINVSDINIAPTGGSARSDLIVVRVKDPQYGATPPTDLANGPYAFPEVISGVSSSITRTEQLNLQEAVYAVARIDIPANTTTGITAGMIKDVRRLATPHYQPFNALQAALGTEYMNVGDSSFKNWPSNAVNVEVPSWATHADVEIEVSGIFIQGDADVNTRVSLGGLTGPEFWLDFNGARSEIGYKYLERTTHTSQGSFDVRNLAGQTVALRLQAVRVFPAHTDPLWIDTSAQVKYRVEFFERPI